VRDCSRDATQLYVKDSVQTFLDNVVIESVWDVTRRWHALERKGDAPVLGKDRPWEHIPYFTYSNHTVRRDARDGLFKCWYEDLELIPEKWGKSHCWFNARLLYAESEDGIHWRKPELDIHTVDGRKTNIVFGDRAYGSVHSANVIIDPRPPAPDERFRMLFMRMWEDEKASYKRMEAAHSADGVHWALYDELPSIGMCGPRLCDVMLCSYDEDAREFVGYTRHFLMDETTLLPLDVARTNPEDGYQPHNFSANNKRRIWQIRSHDFLHWSEPILVAAADDEEDNLDESFYGMPQYKVGNLHLGTVGLFRPVDNEMDVELLMSRDGVRWKRTMKRRPFLAPRGEGYWDAHMVSITSPPTERGDDLWFFYGGTNYHHDYWLDGPNENLDHPEAKHPEAARFGLAIATLRKEGYAGLYANRWREGAVVTRPLITTGRKLMVNAKCAPGGSVRVEVMDRYGSILGDCSRDNCDVFTGDSIGRRMTWNTKPEISQGGRRDLRSWRKLRFFLKDAELFSFRFEDADEDVLSSRPLNE